MDKKLTEAYKGIAERGRAQEILAAARARKDSDAIAAFAWAAVFQQHALQRRYIEEGSFLQMSWLALDSQLKDLVVQYHSADWVYNHLAPAVAAMKADLVDLKARRVPPPL